MNSLWEKIGIRPEDFQEPIRYIKVRLCVLIPAIYAFFWLLYAAIFYFWWAYLPAALVCLGLGFSTSVVGLSWVWISRQYFKAALLVHSGSLLGLLCLIGLTGVVYSPILGWIFFGAVSINFLLGGRASATIIVIAVCTILVLDLIYLFGLWPTYWQSFGLNSFEFELLSVITHICSISALGLLTFLIDQTLRTSASHTQNVQLRLEQSHKDLDRLLQNMHMAHVTILPDLTLGKETSDRFWRFFRRPEQGDPHLVRILTAETEGVPKSQESLEQTLRSLFGKEKQELDSLLDHLPAEWQISSGETARIFKMIWIPLFSAESRVDKLILSLEDITREREAEAQADLAQESSIQLGELIAGVAHDLASPSQLLSDETKAVKHEVEDLERRVLSLFDGAEDSESIAIRDSLAQSLGRLRGHQETMALGIRRIIEIQGAVRNQSRQDLRWEMVSLRELIAETQIILRSKLVKMSIRLDIPEHVSLVCRRSEIGQVLTNLLGNAADAVGPDTKSRTDATDPPTIILRWLVQEGEDFDLLEIEDNGPGFADEVKAQLFRRRITTKATGKGTGLGLILCAKVLAHHGAQLRLTPPRELGGACLAIHWPKHSPHT
jgi:signal transduction histidine kinase